MSAKHTAAPWGVIVNVNHWSVQDTRGVNVAGGTGWGIPGLHGQMEANARLIAAAPDLLAALNAMLTHMGMDEDEWTKPTFDQARAAIAKATGSKQ